MTPRDGDGVSITPRKKKNGQIVYDTRWRDDHGVYRCHTFKDLETAMQFKNGMLATSGRAKTKIYFFSDLVQPYLDRCKRQKAFNDKRSIVLILEKEFSGAISNINTLAVQNFKTRFLENHAPATWNRYFACLTNMLACAVEWDMADERTLRAVKKVKKEKEENRIIRYLNQYRPDEYDRLMKAVQRSNAPELYYKVMIALHTGMREGEILALEWNKIDLANRLIFITQSKSGKPREVPINNTLYNVLKDMPRQISGQLFVIKNNDSFRDAVKRAQIPDFRFHDLRHTFASWLRMRGADLQELQGLLGHSSINMVLRYAHLDSGALSRAVNLLDELDGQKSKLRAGVINER